MKHFRVEVINIMGSAKSDVYEVEREDSCTPEEEARYAHAWYASQNIDPEKVIVTDLANRDSFTWSYEA